MTQSFVVKASCTINRPSALRTVCCLILLPIVFIALGGFADRILTVLLRAGFRGVAVLGFLVVAVLVAHFAFTAILYFASMTRRAVVLHSLAAGITAIWLVLLLARSTVTENASSSPLGVDTVATSSNQSLQPT